MNVTRPSAFVHVACNIFRVEQDMRKQEKVFSAKNVNCRLLDDNGHSKMMKPRTFPIVLCEKLLSSSNISHMWRQIERFLRFAKPLSHNVWMNFYSKLTNVVCL